MCSRTSVRCSLSLLLFTLLARSDKVQICLPDIFKHFNEVVEREEKARIIDEELSKCSQNEHTRVPQIKTLMLLESQKPP